MTLTIDLSDVLLLGYICVALFLVIALYYLIKILVNVNKMTKQASETVDAITEQVWKPIMIAKEVFAKIEGALKKKKDVEEEE